MTGGAAPFRPLRWLTIFAGTALLFGLLLFPARGLATEEFARRTGKECAACHVDPAGGGELNAAGKEFLAACEIGRNFKPMSRAEQDAFLDHCHTTYNPAKVY